MLLHLAASIFLLQTNHHRHASLWPVGGPGERIGHAATSCSGQDSTEATRADGRGVAREGSQEGACRDIVDAYAIARRAERAIASRRKVSCRAEREEREGSGQGKEEQGCTTKRQWKTLSFVVIAFVFPGPLPA